MPERAKTSYWYISGRKSVLAAVGVQGLAKLMKMYSDTGVIGVRPYHPKFFDAITILEDTAAAFLEDKIKFDDSLKQPKDRLAQLG